MPDVPLYCVYQAGDKATVCYRAVATNPATPHDFISFADIGAQFQWHQLHRAVGVSFWDDKIKAMALGAKKKMPYLAVVDLAHADPATPWACTGQAGHVTLWAPAPLLAQAVSSYVDIPG